MSREPHAGPPAPRPEAGPTLLGSTPAPAATAPRPADLPVGLEPLALLKAFRRRWRLAVGLGLLAVMVVAPAAFFLVPPSKYTARARLQIDSEPSRLIFETAESRTQFAILQRTQAAELTAPRVLNHALKGLAELPEIKAQVDPAGWLADQLTARFIPGSELLEISMSGDNPKNLAMIVNAVVKAYMDKVVGQSESQRRDRLIALKALWTEYQVNLRDERKRLRALAGEIGGSDKETTAIAQQYLQARLAQAQSDLSAIRTRIREAEIRRGVLKVRATAVAAPDPMPAEPAGDAVARQIESHPDVQKLREAIAGHEAAVIRARRIAKKAETDPSVREPQRKLEANRKALDDLVARLREEVRGHGRVVEHRAQNQEWKEAEEEFRVLRRFEETLAADVESLKAQTSKTSGAAIDLQEQQAKLLLQEEAVTRVGKEVEALSVELQPTTPQRIRVLDEAEAPKVKDEMRKYKMTGMAGLGAFALVICGVSFLESRRCRIDTADEVVKVLGLRIMGALPALPASGRRRAALAAGRAWEGLLVESIDATRTLLLHASRTDGIRVVMIASAVKGEGKTSTSGHLATSLARAGRRTLLVDCDLRNPAVHRLFDLGCERGLCDALRGDPELGGLICPTGVPLLDVLPAGQVDTSALRALASDALHPILAGLRREYDFIVVDTSPVLPVADALLVSQSTDAVLFSIMREVSQLPKVRAAHDRLAHLGSRILGAVVTGAPPDDAAGYGAGYYRAVPAGHGAAGA